MKKIIRNYGDRILVFVFIGLLVLILAGSIFYLSGKFGDDLNYIYGIGGGAVILGLIWLISGFGRDKLRRDIKRYNSWEREKIK